MSAAEDLMAKFTGGQKGGGNFALDANNQVIEVNDNNGLFDTRVEAEAAAAEAAKAEAAEAAKAEAAEAAAAEAAKAEGGRRRRKSHSGRKGNSWLDHVKYTMKDKKNKGKSFKQILKIAKKTYKRSQSQSSSQSGGKRRKGQNQKSQKKYQNGGSGGKVAGVGASASPYV
jgi:hypothetical protein